MQQPLALAQPPYESLYEDTSRWRSTSDCETFLPAPPGGRAATPAGCRRALRLGAARLTQGRRRRSGEPFSQYERPTVTGLPWPQPYPARLLHDLIADARERTVLAGFDFIVGLPRAYAQRAGVARFVDTVPLLGRAAPWKNYFRWSRAAKDVSLHAPLLDWRAGPIPYLEHARLLGLLEREEFFRRCDGAGAPLFIDIPGAKQVAKAAATGWQEIVQPALAGGAKLWPFHGPLRDLVRPRSFTICETYPRECYAICGVEGASNKTEQTWLNEAAAIAQQCAAEWGVTFEDGAADAMKADEDAFDTVMGALAMIAIVMGRHAPGEPDDNEVVSVEGWMLGRLR